MEEELTASFNIYHDGESVKVECSTSYADLLFLFVYLAACICEEEKMLPETLGADLPNLIQTLLKGEAHDV